MKPGKNDPRYQLRIVGDELAEIHRLAWSFVEAYGLDRKLANYQGKRPLTLYDWDLDLLIDVLNMELASLAAPNRPAWPLSERPNPAALRSLLDRVLALRPPAEAPTSALPAKRGHKP